MKKFFNLPTSYKFEMNDLRAFTTIINVLCIIIFGYAAGFFGLVIAGCGLIKDLLNPERHLNEFLMHSANTILNNYFIVQVL